jgi:hypothetical protein
MPIGFHPVTSRHARSVRALSLCLSLASCIGAIENDRNLGAGAPGAENDRGSGAAGTGATDRISGSGGVSGATSTPSGGPASVTVPPVRSAPFTCPPGPVDPGPAPLLRLTPAQYANTLHDLLGDLPDLDAALPAVAGQGKISSTEVEAFNDAAERAAKTAMGRIDLVAPCAPAADPTSCARQFIRSFGARAYRYPLTDLDVETHLALYQVGAKIGGHAHGVEVLLRGMLQSPRLIYRLEEDSGGAPGSVRSLGPREIAVRLSYGLWNTIPDRALTDAANNGGLRTPAQVAAQAERMMNDPRGRATLRAFVEDWFGVPALQTVDKDTTRFPYWNDSLRDALLDQSREFVNYALFGADGRLSTLLTSSIVLLNKQVAGYYGGGAAGDTFQAVEGPKGRVAGLLTLPAFLAAHSKSSDSFPIYRGLFVREQMLCTNLPSPPAGVEIKPPEVRPGVSTRERFTQHSVDPSCSGCHALIDPIGFLFENFDATGRYRDKDEGNLVDASGRLTGSRDIDGPVVGVPELAQKLTGSVQVQACTSQQWFRHLMGRLDLDSDGCSMASLFDQFARSGYDLRSLAVAAVQTDAFLNRRVTGVSP